MSGFVDFDDDVLDEIEIELKLKIENLKMKIMNKMMKNEK